jgi:hypothetical protein
METVSEKERRNSENAREAREREEEDWKGVGFCWFEIEKLMKGQCWDAWHDSRVQIDDKMKRFFFSRIVVDPAYQRGQPRVTRASKLDHMSQSAIIESDIDQFFFIYYE